MSDPGGGGITINGTGSLTIDHCTIDHNCAWGGSSTGIWLRGNPTTDIENTIISNGYFVDGSINNQGTLTIEYSDFYNNVGSPIVGNVPAGFGELTSFNYNGDSCDVYCNIFMDPMYVDPGNNYHLTATSPCIDAGDPASPYDPDGTITDMGVYYFSQTPIIHVEPSSTALGGMLEISPCPCQGLLTISCSVPAQACADIMIYDLHGRILEEMLNVPGTGDVHYDTAELAAGVYFCRLESGDLTESGTFVVQR